MPGPGRGCASPIGLRELETVLMIPVDSKLEQVASSSLLHGNDIGRFLHEPRTNRL